MADGTCDDGKCEPLWGQNPRAGCMETGRTSVSRITRGRKFMRGTRCLLRAFEDRDNGGWGAGGQTAALMDEPADGERVKEDELVKRGNERDEVPPFALGWVKYSKSFCPARP